MHDDEPIDLGDIAAATITNRKFLVMLASLLVGRGVLTLDLLQDCLAEQAAEHRKTDPAVAAQFEELAKLLDPSALPSKPTPDPEQSKRRPKRG